MAERTVADLTRTGGFVGRQVRARVDTDDLSSEEADRFAALVDRVDLDAPPPPAAQAPAGARDMMRYALTIQRGGRTWQAELSESQVPAELRPLIQYLSAAARTGPA